MILGRPDITHIRHPSGRVIITLRCRDSGEELFSLHDDDAAVLARMIHDELEGADRDG